LQGWIPVPLTVPAVEDAVAGSEMMDVDSEVEDDLLNVVEDAEEVTPTQEDVGVYRILGITPLKIGMAFHRSKGLKY
jgi:hypothetical protein